MSCVISGQLSWTNDWNIRFIHFKWDLTDWDVEWNNISGNGNQLWAREKIIKKDWMMAEWWLWYDGSVVYRQIFESVATMADWVGWFSGRKLCSGNSFDNHRQGNNCVRIYRPVARVADNWRQMMTREGPPEVSANRTALAIPSYCYQCNSIGSFYWHIARVFSTGSQLMKHWEIMRWWIHFVQCRLPIEIGFTWVQWKSMGQWAAFNLK